MTADIVIVDDEKDIRSLIRGILEDEGYVTREASNDKECEAAFELKQPDLVVLDIWLHNSGKDGLQILRDIKKKAPLVQVLMISGHGNIETAVGAIKDGAYDFIEKPFKTDRLLLMVRRALEAASLRTENETLKRNQNDSIDLIGKSVAIESVKSKIKKIAMTNSRVIISGELGTGKEFAAYAIHKASERASAPCIHVNCAMLSSEVIEKHLFGHEEKDAIHYGAIENASKGTLILNNIGHMELSVQNKLMKFLQEGYYQRKNGIENISTDVRLIATSNSGLDNKIKSGDFREDLYNRLNIATIEMPPLRKRTEDIGPLIDYFIQSLAKQEGLLPCEFSPSALAALQAHDWPGNIKQLRNVVEWMMIMMVSNSDESIVSADSLPPGLLNGIYPKESSSSPSKTVDAIAGLPLKEARELFEKEYLSIQLKRFSGNISKTAEFIGMERSALHRKLKQLDVNPTQDSLPSKAHAA